MFSKEMTIADFDPDLYAAMQAEATRQEEHIELIASENYTSPRVMEAQGSELTNKYAEGYPNKRYYGGCEHVDVVEQLSFLKQLGCEEVQGFLLSPPVRAAAMEETLNNSQMQLE